MQTPYFTEGETEPIDPTKIVENEKSAQKNDRGDSGKQEDDEGQMHAPMQKGVEDSVESTRHQNVQNGGFSGVRRILHPAEALDSARHTAELIMKDAMDALIRTKQRLMEILPSLTPSHAADDATKVVENVEKDMLGKAEGGVLHSGADAKTSDKKASEAVTSNEAGSITSNVTVSSPDIQSTKKGTVVAKL